MAGSPTAKRLTSPVAMPTLRERVTGGGFAEGDLGLAAHRLLHREGAGDRAVAGVAVEPAGDGVAGEVDDAAAVGVDVADEGVVDAVEVAGEFLDAAAGAEFAGEGFGEGGEPGDIGEQGGAAGAGGQVTAFGHGLVPVACDVGSRGLHGNTQGAAGSGGGWRIRCRRGGNGCESFCWPGRRIRRARVGP